MNFDEKAITWDNDNRINRAKIISEEISKSIEIKKSYKALEFGCGTGLVSFDLLGKFENISLVDTSKGMIEILNSKIQQNEIKNMTAFQLDINNQKILMGKYDVIYTSMALHHIKDIEEVLKNLYELLNPNGYICIIDLDEEDGRFHSDDKTFDGHNGFNQNKLKLLMGKIGFKNIEAHNFYNGIKVIGHENIEYTLFLMKGNKVEL
jgi:ubiquinone/menaquinone biosynthesis C-methylase UbiE